MGLAFVVTLFYALQRFERIFGTGRFELGYECIDLEVDVIVFGCRSNICICCFFVFSDISIEELMTNVNLVLITPVFKLI